jgi:3-dehydroquinate synthase
VKKIPVKLADASYDVLIKDGLIADAGPRIRDSVPEVSRFIVITSRRVRSLWGRTLESGLRRARIPFSVLTLPDGEKYKDFKTVETLIKEMAAAGADRQSVVIALGGGVVGDIAGFAASIYMRGIPIIQVPTTLLAQVDASIGGKTGVNLPAGKNLVGAFHQPKVVLIDPQALSTLPERELNAGFFEVIKCGVIRDAKLFRAIEDASANHRSTKDFLEKAITASVRVKADIVSRDEREGGLRRILNFGHTIGHALEAEGGYKRLLHGEAVGWGMIAAAKIGEEVGVTPENVSRRIESAVLNYGPLPKIRVQSSAILRLIQTDKKTLHGIPHFVLCTSIGKATVSSKVPISVIRSAIEHINALSAAL